jgi:tetratricopeptide (TPR) repeat protein
VTGFSCIHLRGFAAFLVLSTVWSAAIVPAGAATAVDPAALNARGVSLYNTGRFDDALNVFSHAYRLAPEHPVVRKNLANTYQALANKHVESRDFAGAVERLRMAVNLAPDSVVPLVQLGACYLQLNHIGDAISALEEAITREPGNIDAHALLGEAYYRDGDVPAALVQWEWVAKVAPERKDIRDKVEKAGREVAVEGDYGRHRSRHFVIRYARDTQRQDVRQALVYLERAYRDIGLRLGGVYPPPPIQVVIYTADDFTKATLLDEHVGAVYDGTIRVPMDDRSGRRLDTNELRRRIYHEYVHVVVRHVAGDNVPWWLNEGLAETLSTDLSDAERALLTDAYADQSAFPLADIEAHQLERLDPEQLSLAYRQAHAAVEYLWSRFGQRPLVGLLREIAEGADPEAALRNQYRRDYAMLDHEIASRFQR